MDSSHTQTLIEKNKVFLRPKLIANTFRRRQNDQKVDTELNKDPNELDEIYKNNNNGDLPLQEYFVQKQDQQKLQKK